MTETEKMRAILDELGIEYRAVSNMVTDVEHDGIKTRVYDYDCGPDYQLHVEQKWLTAEEAVRVALGSKPQEDECYFKWSLADNGWADHTCSECGFVENTDIHVELDWNYCPNCGRKVVYK